jgi:hypothetical protein
MQLPTAILIKHISSKPQTNSCTHFSWPDTTNSKPTNLLCMACHSRKGQGAQVPARL